MSRRWKAKEEEALFELRTRLKSELAARPQYPEVVGDRRLLRFLRGKGLKIEDTVKAVKDFLKWRDDNDVDKIRQDIVYGGKDSPFKFPFGEKVIDIAPQIIISANALDKKGRLLAMETFNFAPKAMFEAMDIADFLTYLTYTLEYRALVLEQVSHEREQKYLQSHPDPTSREEGYGVIAMDYTIRDLKGVGMGHLGSKGRALVTAALELSLPNYPEYLERCVLINTPWVFNTFWYFVKGLLDEITMIKINMVGANYMPALLEEITFENIPERLGGGFKLYNEPYTFDLSESGPLFCAGSPLPNSTASTIGSNSNSNSINNTGSVRLSGATSNNGSYTSNINKSAPYVTGNEVAGALIHRHFEVPKPHPSYLQTVTPSRMVKDVLMWALQCPAKAIAVLIFVGFFMFLRESGYLQLLVYPSIVYITIFNTKHIFARLMNFLDIDASI